MPIKLSFSSKNKYLQCAESYRLHYIQRIRSIYTSSALIFGSSVDNALNALLLSAKGNPEALSIAINVFNRNWEQGEDSLRQKVDMPLNPNIEYGRYDFDADLLEKEDWREIFKMDSKFFETKAKVDAEYKATKDWGSIPESDRAIINYANWLCLKRKGELLLTAYYNDILPNIKRVIEVQKKVELLDDDGNNLNGVIDFIAELQDGRIAIVDNKTTSTQYEEDSVAGSEQLATYQQILNIFNEDQSNPWKHKIDACAYAVMSKKLDKNITKTCKSCGHVGQGSHKTCDNVIEGKRCGGDWEKIKEFKVNTQFITGTISDEYAQNVLDNASTVKSCIEAGLFPKNYSACENMFGRACPNIGLCHKGSMKGLIQLEERLDK